MMSSVQTLQPKVSKLVTLVGFLCVVVVGLGPAVAFAQTPQWAEGFGRNATGVPGLDDVNDLIVYNGAPHALGEAVDTQVRALYEWDGASWIGHAFPDNTYRFLRDMVIHDGDIYMGANCGGACIQVARWDGASFYPVGYANSSVHTIASDGANLYVGGRFTEIDGVPARRIAKWDGATWSEFGGGADDYVGFIYHDGSDLYVNGWYHEIGGEPITGIAKWNGASWDSLGSWPSEFGSSSPIINYKGDIYTWIESWTMGRWDGATWDLIPMKYIMYTMAEFNGYLYVTFQEDLKYWMLKWDGTGIPSEYYVSDGPTMALRPDGDKMYIGGLFSDVGGWEIHGVAEWYGESFRVNGCTDDVEDITVAADGVYAGGSFVEAGTATANYVGRWDGTIWHALGDGMSGPVYTVHSDGSDVYAGGMFLEADSILVNRVARWDGSQWHAMGSGVAGFVYEIAGTAPELYVGGNFTQAGGGAANRIARWDGSNWYPLGGGVSATVRSIVIDGTDLYAGGDFYMADGMIVKRIARWDGGQWHEMGGGLSGGVFDMEMRYGDLYVAGNFAIAGGATVNRLALWDGASWSDVGGGFSGSVYALAFVGNDLYAGGEFTKTTSTGTANSVAKWNGTEWSPLAEGTDGRVNVFAVSPEGLYAGGQFSTAGAMLSEHFGLWTVDGTASGVATPASNSTAYLERNTPNPFNPVTTIRFVLESSQDVTLSIYNVSGRLVRTLIDSQPTLAGDNQVVWDGRDDRGMSVVSGVYFYRLEAGGSTHSRKMVLIK